MPDAHDPTPISTLTLTRPDDWHLHLRDGAAMAAVVPDTARQFARAIVMPNLKPPVTTAAQALAYADRIRAAVPEGVDFEPLMTLYLTDRLPPDEIARARDAGVVAVKLYPAGATTNSDAGVTDLRKTFPTLEAMQRLGLPLLVHGEVTDPAIDLFDREAVFIDTQLIPLRRDFPELKIVFEHITTREAAQYVAEAGAHTAATITAHHLLYNRNALFTGGVPAGRAIHRALGGKLEKIVALELGGNNPLVVWDAADLQSTAKLIVKSAYITSGQRCTCSRRLILKAGEEGNAVLDALTSLIDRLTVDKPDAQPQPFIGPLISAHAASQVLATQTEWLRNGGVAIRDSRQLALGPAYLSPGLIDVTALPERRDEETFGPLLQVIRVTDFEAALDEANNTRFGLAAGLISDSADLFSRFEAEVRAGVLNWNRQTTGASGAAPFGGVGQSGNHRPAGYYAADYTAWPMASLIAPGVVKDDEAIVGLRS